MKASEIIVETDRSVSCLFLNNRSSSTPTLFLHGFTGAADSWSEVISKFDSYAVSVDIVGHGKSTFKDLNSDYSVDDCCEDLSEILDSLDIKRLNICGYSMGGRLAVAFAARYPDRVEGLLLESACLGIADKEDRESRYQEDLKLCRAIEDNFAEFVQKWERNSLFHNQSNRNELGFKKQREIRLSHNPAQLSKALRAFSQGQMKSYESEFSKFDFPISIINGSDDSRYKLAGKMMSEMNKQATQHVVDNSNHNVHLESTDAFIDLIK